MASFSLQRPISNIKILHVRFSVDKRHRNRVVSEFQFSFTILPPQMSFNTSVPVLQVCTGNEKPQRYHNLSAPFSFLLVTLKLGGLHK